MSNDPTAPDLTAMMDVFSNIIFFLLASFGAAVLSVVCVTVPTPGSAEASPTDAVTVLLRIRANASVSVSVSNESIHPEWLAAFDTTIPGREGVIDQVRLNDHLWEVKEKYHRSKTVVVVPDGDATYNMMIDAMDAARDRRLIVSGREVFVSLFPSVVASSTAE